jgi:hypothetical protein
LRCRSPCRILLTSPSMSWCSLCTDQTSELVRCCGRPFCNCAEWHSQRQIAVDWACKHPRSHPCGELISTLPGSFCLSNCLRLDPEGAHVP